ncbi:aldose epimerase [Demequina sp. NBRC 110053]|uniref:aldose epimerase family protein n=1 Tax=Demequina sp. NBRC 110053 TaxID=1570342 RepID=UPI0013565A4F|nr:aldose epimerase [Demequina sp. NBRC 110053]
MSDDVTIENEHWRIGFLPEVGGSVAFGQARVNGAWADVLRPSPADAAAPNDTASYPLVPWSNRIRAGRLRWAGRTYQLRVNFPDGTAIHGAGWDYPWNVVEHTDTRVVLELASREVYGVNWPWTFTARFTYELDGPVFRWTYGLTNTDHETFPAGYGHHPYFQRSVAGSPEARLQMEVDKAYDLVDCMPTEAAGEIRPAADFREAREIGQEFVDDCFTDRRGERLATIEWPGAVTVDVHADAELEHAVLYIPPGQGYFAFEPVSNANDAFNLDEAHVPGTGLFLVQPGETRSSTFTLTVRDA